MSELWLPGDDSISSSSLHLAADQFLNESLAAKRALYLANGSSWICKFFQKQGCLRGQECPYRHSRGDKPFVCKFWLRGLCKKGADTCESLHVYDLSKMEYCSFIIDYGQCTNVDCLFNHEKPAVEVIDCPWYARGFCRHGPTCKHRHRVREMCPDYLAGFCELGPACEKGHPKWLLPEDNEPAQVQYDAQGQIIPGSELPRERTLRSLVGMALTTGNKPNKKDLSQIKCNACGQFGHFAGACPNASHDGATGRAQRDMSSVLCFKCWEHGHYASFCTNQKREPPPHLAHKQQHAGDKRTRSDRDQPSY